MKLLRNLLADTPAPRAAVLIRLMDGAVFLEEGFFNQRLKGKPHV